MTTTQRVGEATVFTKTVYQVWSNVLGSVLTEIEIEGASERRTTKVYAGGALIAKQSGANEVGLTTADPVTGTTANLGYTAELGNIGTTEETEPLGQKLRQHDPVAPPEPEPNENRIGSADDPHWQCEAGEQFWGGFSGMPFHCQSKVLQDLSRGLDEIYGFSNPHRPDNPTRISVQVIGGVDSPVNVPSIPFMDSSAGKSPTNLALAKMLQSTSKPSDDKDKPKIVAEVNIPISFDNDSLIDMSDTGWVGADVSNDEYERTPIPEKLDEKIKERLGRGDCNAFIAKLITTAQQVMKKHIGSIGDASWYKITEGQDGYSLVKDAFEQNIIGFEDSPKINGYGVGGYATGSLAKKNAKIVIATGGVYANERKWYKASAHRYNTEKYISTAIHELIHVAGNFGLSDKILAAAVYELGESGKKVDLSKNDSADIYARLNYSGDWGAVLQKHCGKDVK